MLPAPALGGSGLRRLGGHPGIRFLAVGGLSAACDLGMLALLHGVFDVVLAVATACAFCSAFAVNFTLSRQWTFPAGRSGSTTSQLTRYAILVVANLGLTVLIVTGLATAGLNYLVAKAITTAVVALGNFFAYRHWVFSTPPVDLADAGPSDSD